MTTNAILVTGTTGNVGGEVVQALVRGGHQVRALVRDTSRPVPEGAEAVTGDLNKPESMGAALDGVSAAFLLPGYQDMPGLLAEVRRAGVERVVLLSGGSAGGGDMNNAVTRNMTLSEQAVRESGVPWTFLRPSGFMANTLRWLPQLQTGDVVRDAFPNVRVAMIDPYDIGEVAAAALMGGHAGQVHALSGPEPLLPADRIAILAKVLGRDLRFEGWSDEEARVEMTAAMPVEYVDAFFSFYVDGTLDESKVLPTVQEILGRPPRTFTQWATAHADDFRQAA